MGTLGYRFSFAWLVAGLVFCAPGACGGAASTPLDRPPSGSSNQGEDDATVGLGEASTGSSSGGGRDATVDDSNPGDDMSFDAAGDAGADDAPTEPVEAGPPDAGFCGTCAPGNRCCTVPGAVSFGQCYSVLCGPCCF